MMTTIIAAALALNVQAISITWSIEPMLYGSGENGDHFLESISQSIYFLLISADEMETILDALHGRTFDASTAGVLDAQRFYPPLIED